MTRRRKRARTQKVPLNERQVKVLLELEGAIRQVEARLTQEVNAILRAHDIGRAKVLKLNDKPPYYLEIEVGEG